MPTTINVPHDSPSQSDNVDADSAVPDLPKYHGRGFNHDFAIREGYMLPADHVEHSRLDLQHKSLWLHMGSLYPWTQIVEQALADDKGFRPRVFDVGTGSGRWAVDMALQFPGADILGMDLTPPAQSQPIEGHTIPPNCRFDVDDANNSFERYASSFDFVHVRSAEPGIKDFDLFLYDVARALKPNGVLILSTAWPMVFNENKVPLPLVDEGAPGFSWVQRTLHAAYSAYRQKGNYNIECSVYWDAWLKSNLNYINIETTDYYIPLGPWKAGMDKCQTQAAELLQENAMQVLEAFRPLILSANHKEEVIDAWIKKSNAEIMEQRLHGLIKWRYTLAIRKDSPWCERDRPPKTVDPNGARIWPRT